jgi:hypothetical protein
LDPAVTRQRSEFVELVEAVLLEERPDLLRRVDVLVRHTEQEFGSTPVATRDGMAAPYHRVQDYVVTGRAAPALATTVEPSSGSLSGSSSRMPGVSIAFTRIQCERVLGRHAVGHLTTVGNARCVNARAIHWELARGGLQDFQHEAHVVHAKRRPGRPWDRKQSTVHGTQKSAPTAAG